MPAPTRRSSTLSEAAVDAVLVATPHHVLYPVSLAAVRHGKHVLAEKPSALMRKKWPCLTEAASHRCVLWPGMCRFWLGQMVKDSGRRWRGGRARSDDGHLRLGAAARLALVG